MTGGGGFVGAVVTRQLLALGAEVWVTTRWPGTPPRLAGLGERLRIVRADLNRRVAMRRAVRTARAGIVIHLAGLAQGGADPRRLEDMIRTNTDATRHLLDEALAGGRLRRFVFTGTSSEYGAAPIPFRESQRLRPTTPYGVSKSGASLYCLAAAVTAGAPVVILRPSLIYGPGQVGENFLPSLIRAAVRGETFRMSRGLQKRDFLFVDDAADGIVRAAVRPVPPGTVMNLASGREVRLRTLAAQIIRMVGRGRLDLGALTPLRGDPKRVVMDTRMARRLLAWRPRVSLETGLRLTIAAARAEAGEASRAAEAGRQPL